MLDIIIKHGTIVDGTGKDKFIGDLGIQGEKITRIGDLSSLKAEEVINAHGKIVSPGFIDPHSHADLSILIWPENEGNVMQGITTTIGGNCGFSPGPMKDYYLFSAWEFNLLYKIKPQYYNEIEVFIELDKMRKAFKEIYDFDLDYTTMDQFFTKAEHQGFSVNLYPLVGHNSIRAAVIGKDCQRDATSDELEQMKDLVRQSMKAGCRGLSTGLDYIGSYGSTEEIIELAKVAKQYGGIYASHFRQVSNMDKDDELGVLKGIEEGFRIGKEADIRVNLSHMFPGLMLSAEDPLEKKIKAARMISDRINQAREDGVDVTFDVMPNTSGGGSSNPNFGRFFRPWVLAAGSYDQFLHNLTIPDYVEALKRDVKTGEHDWLKIGLWPLDDMIFIVESEVKEFENKSIRMIMRERNWEYIDAMIEICTSAPHTKIRFDIPTPAEWVQEILKHPLSMPSSDGLSFNQDSDFGLGYPLNTYPHPNNFCYTIQYLTQYKKDRIEDTIHAMTGLPAEIFQLHGRGHLKEGNYADVVIFSPEDLATNENYITPGTFPDGIDYVIINGQITCHNKQHTGAKAGKILRRTP